LGRFYKWCDIPQENQVVVTELVKGLKSPVTIMNEAHICYILVALISISFTDKNKAILANSAVIPILFDLMSCKEYYVWTVSITLLSYICNVLSLEIKNMIVKTGIFGILHKKLLEISPPPPTPLLSSNYFSLNRLCGSINSLVVGNSEGVNALLNSSLIPSLLQTLESATSIVEASSHTPDTNVVKIQEYICACFINCTRFSYEQTIHLVSCEVIPSLLVLLEKHMNMMKKKGKKMDELVVRHATVVLFNILLFGYRKVVYGEKNTLKSIFDTVNGIKRLYELFSYLHNQKDKSPVEKEVVNWISLCVCYLLKSDTISPSYVSLLVYVNELRSQPKPKSGYDFPSFARVCWKGLVDVEEYLTKYNK
jgi:hypothetical protein